MCGNAQYLVDPTHNHSVVFQRQGLIALFSFQEREDSIIISVPGDRLFHLNKQTSEWKEIEVRGYG